MSKMSKLTIKSRGQYRNKKGTLVFRYAVSGGPDAMKAYQDAQGEYFTQDATTDEVLYFTTKFCGKTATLVVTEEGKIYPDMSELEQQASFVAQLGGNLGEAMAAEIAKKLASSGPGSAPSKSSSKDDGDGDDEQDEKLDEATAKPAARRRR
jgi:hypothetical protein